MFVTQTTTETQTHNRTHRSWKKIGLKKQIRSDDAKREREKKTVSVKTTITESSNCLLNVPSVCIVETKQNETFSI